MGRLIFLVSFLFLNLACSQYQAGQSKADLRKTFVAKVIRIIDGDTMEVLYKKMPIKVRLSHIDCPEKRAHQPFGNEAKETLSDLCFGQNVTLQVESTDRYKRLIAIIINDKKQIVNQEMIKRGMAWHFKTYSTDIIYANLELEARNKKIGLWKEPNPVPPWEWRKTKHPVGGK